MSPTKSWQKHWQAGVLMIAMFVAACTRQEASAIPSPNSLSASTQIPKTSTPIPTQTLLRPTLTSTVTPVMDIVTALALEFDIPAVCLFSNTYLVSKDQNWIGTDCKINQEVIIANKLTGTKVAISFLDLGKTDPICFSTRPLHWSSDNKYFYFTGRCYEQYGGNEMGSLYQVNLKNKAWNTLIRADYEPYYYFSDTGDHLVYVNQHKSGDAFEDTIEIGMVEISSGENKRLVLSSYYYISTPANYAWSRNNDKFAVVLDKIILNEMRTEEVALKIDFKKMDMWLVEEFSGINLLVNE